MSRPGITYQEVANAALHIQGLNENPTVDRVREFLTTGSKSTIARYLKEWKSKTGHIPGADTLPQDLISLVKGLWERLKTEAEQKITDHQEEADRTITEIRAVYFQEQKHNAELLKNIHKLEEDSHEKSRQIELKHQAFEEEKYKNTILSERNAQLTQQLLDQKAEAERLHQHLAHVQTNLEHYQASIEKLREEQILAIEKQKSTYEQEIKNLKRENLETHHEKNQLIRKIVPMEHELKLMISEKEKLNEESLILQKQLNEKTVKELMLQQNSNRLEELCLDYQNEIKEKNCMVIELEKKVAIFSNQALSLQQSLKDAQDKIQILRDEKLFLAQEKSHLQGQLQHLELKVG